MSIPHNWPCRSEKGSNTPPVKNSSGAHNSIRDRLFLQLKLPSAWLAYDIRVILFHTTLARPSISSFLWDILSQAFRFNHLRSFDTCLDGTRPGLPSRINYSRWRGRSSQSDRSLEMFYSVFFLWSHGLIYDALLIETIPSLSKSVLSNIFLSCSPLKWSVQESKRRAMTLGVVAVRV